MILAMEDDCLGQCSGGLVPSDRHRIREALLAIMSAVLIAGGQHSLSECIAVAQAMGYFTTIPQFMQDYPTAIKAFENYAAQNLGVGQIQSSVIQQGVHLIQPGPLTALSYLMEQPRPAHGQPWTLYQQP